MLLKSVVVLFVLSASAAFAASWTGVLVDSGCYAAEQRNVNPTDTETSVDVDVNSEIRYCSPSAKTKSFTFVDPVGETYRLDPAGNVKAADLVRRTGKRSRFEVSVTGQRNGKAIQVDSISSL